MADYTGYGDAPNDDLSLRQAWANILRGLSDKQSWQDLGQGIQNTAQIVPNVAESVTRGNIAGTIGAFGDLRDFKNSIQSYLPQSVQNFQAAAETISNPMARALVQRSPTAENVYDVIPRITDEYEGYKQHEKIGEFIGPAAGGVVYDIAKLGKGLPVGASIKAVDEVPKPEPFKPEKSDLGFYSAVEDVVGNLKQEKGTGQQFLAQISKAPSVKAEELSVTGLDKFLADNPKVTRKEIMEYLANNKTKLEETVLDEGHTARGTYEDYQLGREEAIDDPDYISGMADDLAYDYKNDPNMVEQIREELLAKYPEKYADVEHNDVLAEQLLKDVDSEIESIAYQAAESSYWDNPIYRMEDEFGYQVIGNSDMGYSIKDPNGKWLEKHLIDIGDVEAYLRDTHLDNGDLRFEQEGPKYSDYQLPNGENYREVLIQYPDAKGTYSSSHFDEPNILAHMRVNDRVIDGKKTLFIEEIQSDWHQSGRKKGYAEQLTEERKMEIRLAMDEIDRQNKLLNEERKLQIDDEQVFNELSEKMRENSEKQAELRAQLSPQGVPDAPFKKNWQELAMKRAMQMAVDGGYDRIAFTTGAQQADRYSLAKQIDSIDLKPAQGDSSNRQYVLQAWKDDRNVIRRAVNEDELEDYIGKEAARKILEQTPDEKGVKQLSGLDLEVGGEGMKGFYDKILPDFVNKYGKKYGMKVGQTNLAKVPSRMSTKDIEEGVKNAGFTMDEYRNMTPQEKAKVFDTIKGEQVHYFDLTPEAKSSFLEKGSPLFAAPAIGLTGEESRREILEKLMK